MATEQADRSISHWSEIVEPFLTPAAASRERRSTTVSVPFKMSAAPVAAGNGLGRGHNVKGLSGFLFLLAISMVANALTGKWAFDRTQEGGKWVALDLLIAAGFLLGSIVLWNVAKRRELRKLVREQGLDR